MERLVRVIFPEKKGYFFSVFVPDDGQDVACVRTNIKLANVVSAVTEAVEGYAKELAKHRGLA